MAIYGPQSKFGYKDFIPHVQRGEFDPDAWADLFVRAGAHYVVPVAEHSDGFAMYDSKFTLWDAARMGPKRDVVAALEKAVRARGLRFGVSSHRAEHWWWYHGARSTTPTSTIHVTQASTDPRSPWICRAMTPRGSRTPAIWSGGCHRRNLTSTDWLARSTELVDEYHPDFIYFDWWISQPAFTPDLKRMAAYYYDVAARSTRTWC